jgi:sec-independent protein translocase protein TatB
VFNLSGSELIFLVLIALVVLGPDKLPEAMRRAGKLYNDFKKMTAGFQDEMRSVLDEPLRELRETADLV